MLTAIFGSLTYLMVLCVLGLLIKVALKSPQQKREDFEEFYLDLYRFNTVANFTEAEAQALYRVYQQREYAMSS